MGRQADALTFPLDGYDVIHASPPCQHASRLKAMHPSRQAGYPRLIEPTRERLINAQRFYVIENVEGADLVNPVLLCGSMFDLRIPRGQLRRHRLFECNFPVTQADCMHIPGVSTVGVYGHGGHSGKHRMQYRQEAATIMRIGWMNRDELAQAIPPAYTKYVGMFARLAVPGVDPAAVHFPAHA